MKRKTLALILVLCLMVSIPAFGAVTSKKINVLINTVKIFMGGRQLSTDTIIYNGKVYAPVEDITAALGVDYKQNKDTGLVTLGKLIDTNTKGYSRDNPADINEMVLIESGKYDFEKCKAEITLKEVIRGEKARTILVDNNDNIDAPPEGYEYVLAKINFKLIEAKGSYSLTGLDFYLISSRGKQSKTAAQLVPNPDLSTELYSGAENEGWVLFYVEKTDDKPVLTFGREYKGAGGAWFKAY